MTIAVGVAAIVMTAGAATPLVVGAFVAGSGTVAYGGRICMRLATTFI
ncbi:hypothetical protein QLT07_01765 [Streptococcus equi subsp. zooepidemicus]|nr:hypothetical protein [Streptococcus equi]MDI6043318.1 hypothetical protein [Streptococcus equi subsp. zooepidemicus]